MANFSHPGKTDSSYVLSKYISTFDERVLLVKMANIEDMENMEKMENINQMTYYFLLVILMPKK